ncbi:MAG TPA: phenol hydroxylase subunit P4 [Sporichthya sp.]|nr:phenol hydroxylase subunit P4 [Sporichthya sp.]
MPVVALKEGYEFPSRSRQELYGDDQLVHVMWRNNRLFVAAACFRAPQAMPFAAFMEALVEPWASSDPAFVPGTPKGWMLDDKPWSPDPALGLREQGVGHKSLITFET